MCDKLAGDHRFRRRRQRMGAVVVEQHDTVVVAAETVLDQVADDQRDVLPAPLGLRVGLKISALGGKADAERAIRQRRDLGQNVRILDQFDRSECRLRPS